MNLFHSTSNAFARSITSYFDDRLKEYGLATSYVELLLLIRRNDEKSQKEIADELSLAPSTVTRFVDKLVKKGYVEKMRDGREVSVRLSAKGAELSKKLEKEYQAVIDELTDLVGEKYIDTVGKLLEYGSSELNKGDAD